MYAFGNVGFPKMDRERRFWMGLVTLSTIISIGVTLYGAMALAENVHLISRSRWVTIRYSNVTSGERYNAFVGLRALVYQHEPCDVLGCKQDLYTYTDTHPHMWPDQYLANALEECRTNMHDNAFGAFITCATLIFALIGTVNRMKRSSDANVQKLLGMTTDLCGAISLGLTLIFVYDTCVTSLEKRGPVGGMRLDRASAGPGFHAYVYCLFTACLRAVGHWVTPTPGRGAGCVCTVPKDLVRIFSPEKDGKLQLTWQEFKSALQNSSMSKLVLKYEHNRNQNNEAGVDFDWDQMTGEHARGVLERLPEAGADRQQPPDEGSELTRIQTSNPVLMQPGSSSSAKNSRQKQEPTPAGETKDEINI